MTNETLLYRLIVGSVILFGVCVIIDTILRSLRRVKRETWSQCPWCQVYSSTGGMMRHMAPAMAALTEPCLCIDCARRAAARNPHAKIARVIAPAAQPKPDATKFLTPLDPTQALNINHTINSPKPGAMAAVAVLSSLLTLCAVLGLSAFTR